MIGCIAILLYTPQILKAQTTGPVDYTIHINQFQFDPLLQSPDIPAAFSIKSGAITGNRYMMVQFKRHLKRADRILLTEKYGLQLDRYISGCTYIEYLDEQQIRQLKQLDIFRWIGLYEPMYKVSQGIGKQNFQSEVRQNLDGLLLITVLQIDTDSEAFQDFLSKNGAKRIRPISNTYTQRFEFVWPKEQSLAILAKQNEVFHIFEVAEINYDNGTTTGTIQSGTPGVTPLYDQDLHGEGEVIHVLDSELDIDHCFFEDAPNVPGPAHRKVKGLRGIDSDNGHGTFVAGIAAGDDISDPGNHENRGIAWASCLTFSNSGSADFLNNLIDATTDGAFIHTNSWHLEPVVWYDQLSFDIDLYTWFNEDHLVLGSAGNVGERLGAPGTAKNAICVGAAQADPNEMNFGDGNPGPTPDFRLKPDLFSVGCTVNSAEINTECGIFQWGNCATSWATPAVAGSAALVRQYYREGFYPTGSRVNCDEFTPSGALIKATLLNSTIDMTGIAGYPGIDEGWGLTLLDNGLYFEGDDLNSRVWDVRHVDGLDTDETHTYFVQVLSNTQPLKITMAYSDAPGTVDSDVDVLTNDLDLVVTAPDGLTTFRG